METTFMNTENSKTNESHKFVLNLSQRLDLRSLDKHVVLQKFIYLLHMKKYKKQYKNNKIKIIAPTWNDEFELLDCFNSVSDIEDYIEFIIKNHETLTTFPPIYIHINTIIID